MATKHKTMIHRSSGKSSKETKVENEIREPEPTSEGDEAARGPQEHVHAWGATPNVDDPYLQTCSGCGETKSMPPP